MSSLMFILTIFIIGFLGSFISGMVGIGGAIINFPMLLYIPAMLGVAHFTSYEVSGITAIQVFFASVSGALAYRKGGYLNKTIVMYMGISILAGSLAGAYLSSFMAENEIDMVYGLLALAAAVMMFVPKKGLDSNEYDISRFNGIWASILAFIVGIGAGIVGAGGAFMLVPIMLLVLKIPVRMTIAASLAITFISSIGSAAGKILTGQILYGPAAIMIIASLISSPMGAKLGKKMDTKVLQGILAVLILVTAIKIWLDLF
ncbi:sulfite exporter TauE/SafE family protein [Virgibacillus halophilus]|uniref:Probable membrane transporter protein n=2 Tax=Tigheibacillus halophilus TaxID=361280 RepID=A0ABU5CC74_9BACI|nr:sulfite exporter TauE/SafE family protein [Virgibacillus halophilus]